eukprot:165756-Chlamydomonas_euryale.AAC.1
MEELVQTKSHPPRLQAPVVALRYVPSADTVVSCDAKGFLEYWSATDYGAPKDSAVRWEALGWRVRWRREEGMEAD